MQRLGLGEHSHAWSLPQTMATCCSTCSREIFPSWVEPTRATAKAARAKGINTVESFFGLALAEELEPADPVVANNVLAHVPNINDFVAGIARLLKPQGRARLSFLIYCSYLRVISSTRSTTSITAICFHGTAHCFDPGLEVVDVEQLPTHGGSLRVS